MFRRKAKQINGTKPYMTWLFAAFFEDGSVIQQDQEDIAKGDKPGSAFTDVVNHPSKLIAFELRHADGKQAVTVDLVTGNFVLNGTPLQIHEQYFNPEKHDLQLIYFRETRVDQDVTGTVKEDGQLDGAYGDARHYINRYFIGWETGKTKVTLAVG